MLRFWVNSFICCFRKWNLLWHIHAMQHSYHSPFTIPMQSHFPIQLILLWEYLRSSFRFIHKITHLFILHNFVTLSGSVSLIALNLNDEQSEKTTTRMLCAKKQGTKFHKYFILFFGVFFFRFHFMLNAVTKCLVFAFAHIFYFYFLYKKETRHSMLYVFCSVRVISFLSISKLLTGKKPRNGSNGEWSAPKTKRKWGRKHIQYTRASKRTSNFILS